MTRTLSLTCALAFGGTLSSYTWICLIIAFLQLRTPSVLPSLHQLPYKTQKPNGAHSDFADNLKKLRGFGAKNKSSEAALLFQFFRFYAHEFDYDKYVLVVRLGNMIPKTDKNWQFAVNNQLCVEEPFNHGRNLGNTADEYSFRGLHMELRRAFDLISAAKFEEACEEYVFPKEEERVWTRPPSQPRPVLLRSASQTHSGSGRGGRGGHRGGRHNNHHRGGGGPGSNRRTSTTVAGYDNTTMFAPTVNIQQDLSWYPNGHLGIQYPQDFLTHLALHQQENFRQMQHLYAQAPAFGQQQSMGHPMMASASTGQSQSSDRSRTNSFDNQPPMAAPLRPDLFTLYGMTLGSPLFTQAGTGYAGYPTSPATTSGTGQDYRRPLQRSTVTTDKGAAASSSSLRSQSQPAARSPSAAQPTLPGQYLSPSQSATKVSSVGSRNPNGIPIPSFMPDDAEFDETPKPSSTPPHSEETKYATYISESPGTSRAAQQPQMASNGIAFGDLANQPSSSNPGRRRLSTDQLPQTILDRRMKRTSRSPSPMGHSRAFSTGTTSASTSAAVPGSSTPNRNQNGPLVVNGSGPKARISAASRLASSTEGPAPREAFTPAVGHHMLTQQVQPTTGQQPQSTDQGPPTAADQPPIIVNGSNSNPAQGAEDQSFRERMALMSASYMTPSYLAQESTFAGSGGMIPGAQHQNAVIAPLDLAISNRHVRRPAEPESQVLSPVYETHAPSPTSARKPDMPSKTSKASHSQDAKHTSSAGSARQNSKLDEQGQRSQEATKPSKNAKAVVPTPKVNGSREGGHVRGARSETDQGWQKAGKGKKKAASTTQPGNAEPQPKHTSERKGG